jgi:hypothetical protein
MAAAEAVVRAAPAADASLNRRRRFIATRFSAFLQGLRFLSARNQQRKFVREKLPQIASQALNSLPQPLEADAHFKTEINCFTAGGFAC